MLIVRRWAVEWFPFWFLPMVLILAGCLHRHLPPQQGTGGATVGDAADQTEKSAHLIDGERKAIEQEAPDTKPHTDIIGGEVGTLLATVAKLHQAEQTIESDRALCDKKDARIKELEDGETVMLKRWLGVIAILALIGVPVCAVGIKSVGLAATCGAVSATCLTGIWLLVWAKWIAMGSLAAIALVVLYAIFIQHQTLGELASKAKNIEGVLSKRAQKLVKPVAAKAAPGVVLTT